LNDYKPSFGDIKRVTKKALQFAEDAESKKLHSPSVTVLFAYNIMRGMGQHYTEKSNYPTEDGHWWSSDERKNFAYFPQVKLPFYYLIGKWLGGMEFMRVTYKK